MLSIPKRSLFPTFLFNALTQGVVHDVENNVLFHYTTDKLRTSACGKDSDILTPMSFGACGHDGLLLEIRGLSIDG